MSENTHILRNQTDLERLIDKMKVAKINPEKPVRVNVGFYSRDRSLAQNRLAFKWYGERARQFGNTIDHEHQACKLQFGVPILVNEDEDFAELYHNAIKEMDYQHQLKAMKYIQVSSLMNVKQMTEYLNQIDTDSISQGLRLTHPDYYGEAMGK